MSCAVSAPEPFKAVETLAGKDVFYAVTPGGRVVLKETAQMTDAERQRYSGIIHDETIRLTRLLDDLLDLSVLENGQVTLNEREETLESILVDLLASLGALDPSSLPVAQVEGQRLGRQRLARGDDGLAHRRHRFFRRRLGFGRGRCLGLGSGFGLGGRRLCRAATAQADDPERANASISGSHMSRGNRS